MGIHTVRIFFLFLNENMWRGAYNEYPQCMFSGRNKKSISTLIENRAMLIFIPKAER